VLYKQSFLVSVVLVASFVFSCGPSAGSAHEKADATGAPAPRSDGLEIRGDSAHQIPACRACRMTHCTNYEGLLDLVKTCFENPDAGFRSLCMEAKDCATRAGCGYSSLGSSECFCGSADLEACQTPGAANGPCKKEFSAAARASSLAEIATHFGDLTYPSGVAHYLHACDRDYCEKECRVGQKRHVVP